MPTLLTTRARRRALESWKVKAESAWHALGRLHLRAWAAELDGHGDPHVTLRWQVLLARVRFYWQRVCAALTALEHGHGA